MLVENFPCQDENEASAREKYYIINNPCVNKNIPGRTQKEYKIAHKEKIKSLPQMVYAQYPKTLITLEPELFSPVLKSSIGHA